MKIPAVPSAAAVIWFVHVVLIIGFFNPNIKGGNGLRLLNIHIPNYTIYNMTTQLECRFDMEGALLYSVKWYKDGKEFYRYVPQDSPPAQGFPLPGVNVDVKKSSATVVSLKDLTLRATGRYRCEVSAEAPSFQTVSDHSDMIIVVLPTEGPTIYGGKPRYSNGEWVRLNCTSGNSKPAAKLVWFVNGDVANDSLIQGPYTSIAEDEEEEELETSYLGLMFPVTPEHFRKGDLKLKCLAKIADLFWRSNEESVEGDKLLRAAVLESRATDAPGKSRADRVQGESDPTDYYMPGPAETQSPPPAAGGQGRQAASAQRALVAACGLLALTKGLAASRMTLSQHTF